MKNFKMSLTLAILITGFSSSLFAQASATASATATIVTPIAIGKTADMNFGNVAVINSGTVILAPAGTRTSTGGVTLPATNGTVTAASFNVTGEGAYTYSITLPASHTITHTNTVNEMVVNNFTSAPSGTGALTSGAQVLNVGATLNVGSGQLAGTYSSGSPFSVTVNYN